MKHRKLIAFLAAIIATFAIWQILNTQNKNKEAQMDYREVIVAAGEIKKGEVIPRSKLTLKKIPRQYTPEDALEDGNSAIGKNGSKWYFARRNPDDSSSDGHRERLGWSCL
ncbi:MAG: hypothetical protein ACLTCQ_07950 [Enterocloster bolteae]